MVSAVHSFFPGQTDSDLYQVVRYTDLPGVTNQPSLAHLAILMTTLGSSKPITKETPYVVGRPFNERFSGVHFLLALNSNASWSTVNQIMFGCCWNELTITDHDCAHSGPLNRALKQKGVAEALEEEFASMEAFLGYWLRIIEPHPLKNELLVGMVPELLASASKATKS